MPASSPPGLYLNIWALSKAGTALYIALVPLSPLYNRVHPDWVL